MSVSTQPGQTAFTCTSSGGERPDEPEQAGLRGAVRGVARDGDAGEDRGDHDDVPPLRPRREVTHGRAEAPVGAEEVRPDDLLEAVVGPVCVRTADAAVGDERVDRATGCCRRRERGVDLRPPADVAVVRVAPDVTGDGLELLEVRREERQHRAVGGEPLRDRFADSPPAAGDDDVPSGQSVHPASESRSLRQLRPPRALVGRGGRA
jgi:hypothetical protein